MVNRVMEAKNLKRLRQLRKPPVRMPGEVEGRFNRPDYVPDKLGKIPVRLLAEGMVAPRQPTRELMEGYKHRAQSLALEDKPGRFVGVPPGRKEADLHIERIRSLCDDEQSFTILNTRVHRARVFYNPQRTVFVLYYEQFKEQRYRSSLPHASKFELVAKFQKNILQWVEYQSIV